jgi:hypothetical protein
MSMYIFFSVYRDSPRFVWTDLSPFSIYCDFGVIVKNLHHVNSFSIDKLFCPTFWPVCTEPPVAHVADSYMTWPVLSSRFLIFVRIIVTYYFSPDMITLLTFIFQIVLVVSILIHTIWPLIELKFLFYIYWRFVWFYWCYYF